MRSENSEKNIFLQHGNMERNTGFLYTHDTDKLYQLSLSSDGNYTMSPDIAASIREQIDKLDEKTYAVKRKWDVLECDNEVYICKIAQKNGIALGCIVNVKVS